MMRNRHGYSGLAALLLAASAVQAADVALTPKGFAIHAGDLGDLVLDYPSLTVGSARQAPTAAAVSGAVASLTYANGASLRLELAKAGGVQIHATQLPSEVKGISLTLTIPPTLAGQARWSIDGAAPQPLPAAPGKDAFLFKHDAKRLVLTDAAGAGFSIALPHGFQQLQDNRVWNTPTFQWIAFAELPRSGAGEATFTLRLGEPGDTAGAPAAVMPASSAKPAAAVQEHLALGVTEKGIHVTAGSMGSFTLDYPVLDTAKLKPVETRVEGAKATLRYANGGTIEVTTGDGKIVLTFAGMPPATKSFGMAMLIPFNYNVGGSWKTGDGGAPFPTAKPEKPHLYQGHSTAFTLTSVDNKHLAFTVPEFSYQQLTDNREWGWSIYNWTISVPYNRDHKSETIAVSMDASNAQRVVLVDKFGQTTRRDFPGKLKDEAELKTDIAQEQAYFAAFASPARDAFGGLPESGSKLGLQKTGFFHVEKKTANGRDLWVLVDPAGNAFFHLGVCSFGPGEDYTYVEGRHDIYDWLPPHSGEFAAAWNPESYWNPRAVSFYKANVIRKYGAPFDDAANVTRMVDRVRRAGFNSVGAFSGNSPVYAEKGFPRVTSLPLGYGFAADLPGLRGVFDPFEPKVLAQMDTAFAKSVAANASDPLLIGYFLANEQGFEDLPRAAAALSGKHAAKQRLIEMLQKKYPDIAAFNTAWGMNAASFEALADRGLPLTTKAAFDDMQAFSELFLDTYYRSITETFHKYDTNHMLIGNRWQPGTANNETLCRVAGTYMDVISINYYTAGIDAAFIRRLYEWTGHKPQMWSEFYYTAEKESNVSAGGNDMATQQERGLAYRNYVEGAAALGFVVGTEWFTLIDQAVTGRFFEKENGERANTGLFNVADRPYQALLAEMAKTHAAIYDVWLNGKAPYILDNPRFSAKSGHATRTVSAGRTLGPMKIDGQLDNWPGRPPERISGDRLAVGRESAGLEAAFKVAWDDANLYLLVNVTDATPMMNAQESSRLWSADGLELFIGSEKIDQGGTLLFTDRQILLGGGKGGQFYVANVAAQPAIETAVVPAVDGKGYTVEALIPWSALALTPKAGTELLFDLAVDNSNDGKGRTCQLMWNGGARNSSDRGAWGRLKLVP